MSLRSVIVPSLIWFGACATSDSPDGSENEDLVTDPDPDPDPGPGDAPNLPPEFSGDVASSVIENVTVELSVEVADPDGDAVEVTLTEQDDGSLFTLDPTTLTVSSFGTFDFERPTDVDGNNTYEFVVVASDGEATVEQRYPVAIENDDRSFDDLGATVLIGEGDDGSFGRNLAAVDDMDGDGRRELLVSAPFAFPDAGLLRVAGAGLPRAVRGPARRADRHGCVDPRSGGSLRGVRGG